MVRAANSTTNSVAETTEESMRLLKHNLDP